MAAEIFRGAAEFVATSDSTAGVHRRLSHFFSGRMEWEFG